MMINKRVKLIRMEDPYTDLKKGDKGTVEGEDSIGQIIVKWDSGATLPLDPKIDEYIIEKISKRVSKFFEFNKILSSDIDFIDGKMQELSDLTKMDNCYFEWSLETIDGSNFLEVRLSINEEDIISEVEWFLDIDSLVIEMTASVNSEFDSETKKPHSLDDALDIIEKDIHYWIGVSESYNFHS